MAAPATPIPNPLINIGSKIILATVPIILPVIASRLAWGKGIAFLPAKIYLIVSGKHGDHIGIVAVYRRTDLHNRARLRRHLPAGDLIMLFCNLISRRTVHRADSFYKIVFCSRI